ncbi:hypothetical protein SAMN05444388_107152 [Flavobacterium johnsoniae]|uniref:Uncharacterized protein n=2 Tax=Flavobacterium johnsoniae TaxID=986 RepID=A0A1M5QSF5_FLAJO|nr:hypothetical protein SAMN05444388_107152 [Flavobacterium johnsoniae]
MYVPFGLKDEALFLTVRSHLIELLCTRSEIFYFGMAPDNTADGQDELLQDGVFYRIIGYEKNLGIDLENSAEEILSAFHYLVDNFVPRWSTLFVEEGKAKKQITIELLYQEVF